jgi:hypothetical protein
VRSFDAIEILAKLAVLSVVTIGEHASRIGTSCLLLRAAPADTKESFVVERWTVFVRGDERPKVVVVAKAASGRRTPTKFVASLA